MAGRTVLFRKLSPSSQFPAKYFKSTTQIHILEQQSTNQIVSLEANGCLNPVLSQQPSKALWSREAPSVLVPAICMLPVLEGKGKLQYLWPCRSVLWPAIWIHGDCAAVKEHNCILEVSPCDENSQQLLDECLLLPYQSLSQVSDSHGLFQKHCVVPEHFFCAGECMVVISALFSHWKLKSSKIKYIVRFGALLFRCL